MAEVCFKYESPTCLDSCAGHNELQAGEQVILPLSDKNPDWPDRIIADVTAVELGKVTDGFSRRYTFCYDDEVLNGGPPIEDCDFEGDPRCFGCCDALDERVTVLEGATDADTITTVVPNANGDHEVFVNGELTETIPANNVTVTSTPDGSHTVTDSTTGESFTVSPTDADTITMITQNANGDYEVFIDGVLTETIPANNVTVTNNTDGTQTVTDSATGVSFTGGSAENVTLSDQTGVQGSSYVFGDPPVSAPSNPIEGDTHFENYNNGQVQFTYDADSGDWVPLFVAPSILSAFAGNTIPQIHSANGNVTISNSFDPSTSNLTSPIVQGAVEELANKNRPHAPVNATQANAQNDDDVPITTPVYRQASEHINVSQAEGNINNNRGYALSVGDEDGRNDVYVQNGRIDHGTFRTQNPLSQLGSFLYRGITTSGSANRYAVVPTNNDTRYEIWNTANQNQADRLTGGGHFRMTAQGDLAAVWRQADAFDSMSTIRTFYVDNVEAENLVGHRFSVIGQDFDGIRNNFRDVVVTHGGVLAIVEAPVTAGGITDPIWDGTNGDVDFQFSAMYAGGGGLEGGYVSSRGIATKITPHAPPIVDLLKKHNLIAEEIPSDLAKVNFSVCAYRKCVFVEEGDVFLTYQLDDGSYKGIDRQTGKVLFEGSDESLMGLKTTANLGLKETDETWSLSAKERFEIQQDASESAYSKQASDRKAAKEQIEKLQKPKEWTEADGDFEEFKKSQAKEYERELPDFVRKQNPFD